jgi:hypothetical protein
MHTYVYLKYIYVCILLTPLILTQSLTINLYLPPDDVPLTFTEASQFYQFDHGCQFFCASHEKFKEKVTEWEKSGMYVYKGFFMYMYIYVNKYI